MIPGTVMYVYIGSLAGDLASLGTEPRTRSSMEWGMYVLGLIATIVVTALVTRIARNALRQRIAA